MRKTGPEKLVEAQVRAWANRNNFDLSVVDTSAVFNPVVKRYVSRRASESLPDLIGNHGSLSVWIELKAPGKRAAINQQKHQKVFLMRKINQGCFACVTDSVEHINQLWLRFRSLRDPFERRSLLIKDLPVSKDDLPLIKA